MTSYSLTHLKQLEAESIHIIREVVAEVKVVQTLLSRLAGNKAKSVARKPAVSLAAKSPGQPRKADDAQSTTAGNGGIMAARSESELRAMAPRDDAETYEIIRTDPQENRVALYLQPILTTPAPTTNESC